MTRMMPRFVVIAAIASLMFVTGGCVSKSDFDTKVSELKAQSDKLATAEKAVKDAEAKIKDLAGAVAGKIQGLEKDLAAAKEAAAKDATDAAAKIKALEGQLAAAQDAAAKAQQAQKDAEAKLKAMEKKPAPKTPADEKPAK